MPDLILYTESFPFNRGETFLETELQYLSNVFDTITIQPLSGKGVKREVPGNVKIIDPIGIENCSKLKMYLTGVLNIKTLLTEKTLRNNLGSVSILKAIKYIGLGFWIKDKISINVLLKEAVHYSYWLNYSALSLALLSMEKKIPFFVSRAHRYDLYLGQGESALDFIKKFTIENLNKLFFISEHGLSYASSMFYEYSGKFQLSRLGTQDHGFEGPLNKSEKLVMVSCSSLKPVKRVGLILEALICLSDLHSDLEVDWFHFGDGDSFKKISGKVLEKLDNTLIKCNLAGSFSNIKVFEFYKKHEVDIFINVSVTEGIPVSIMEAQSFGIPVLATDTGGTPEIVNNNNGLLIDVNITPEELANVIYRIYLNRADWNKKRVIAKENWVLKFNAGNNYRLFALDLKDSYLKSRE